MRVARRMTAGVVWETIVGIMKKKWDAIWIMVALLLMNMRILPKKSMIRYIEMMDRRMRENNLRYSLIM
jgi:hypothetical protein